MAKTKEKGERAPQTKTALESLSAETLDAARDARAGLRDGHYLRLAEEAEGRRKSY